jgi:hypothetical protein
MHERGRSTDTSDSGRPEQVRKLEDRIEGRIDTSKLHTKPRKKFAEDGRLKRLARAEGGTWP